MIMKELDYSKIGLRVRQARKSKGYTQETLAGMIGISTPHMSHIETADSKVGLQVLIKIANALEVSANDLLYDSLSVCTDSYPENEQRLKEALDSCTPDQQDQLLTLVDEVKKIFHIG